MATTSERANTEEYLPINHPAISGVLSSGIIGLTNGLTYNPSESNRSPLTPDYLSFAAEGLSNGLSAGISGIYDFTTYNPYIHHVAVSDTGLGAIGSALNNAGIGNFSSSSSTTVNVMANIVFASNRYEIYSRQFRG